eukprot:8609098-Pyramimonas_sp.AAC.1
MTSRVDGRIPVCFLIQITGAKDNPNDCVRNRVGQIRANVIYTQAQRGTMLTSVPYDWYESDHDDPATLKGWITLETPSICAYPCRTHPKRRCIMQRCS